MFEIVMGIDDFLIQLVKYCNNMCRAKVQFYVYVDNGSEEEYNSGLYRCRELKKLNCNAFLMYNIDNERPQRIKDLQRWANRKSLFWQFDIGDYKQAIDTRSQVVQLAQK